MRYLVPLFLILLGSSMPAVSQPLETALSSIKDLPREHILDGIVEAVNQATVSAQVAGRITEVNFDVDDVVKKNAVLVRLSDTEYKARVSKAEASVQEALAQQQDADLAFKRSTDMFNKKVISASDFDRADAALKSATARVAAAKASLKEANEMLAHTIIRAPFGGVVTKRQVQKGETVNPGQAVMTGLSLDHLRVSVNVPQAFINHIRQQQQARIIITEDNREFPASELTVFPFADPQHHTFRVRANLPAKIDQLFPGMLVKVAFTVGTQKRLLIPARSLVKRSEVTAVYVVDSHGNVRLRQVRPGMSFGKEVEILAGLEAGEAIAIDPVLAGVALKTKAGAAQ